MNISIEIRAGRTVDLCRPYTINSEQGKIVIHIANEAFEVPRDLQRLASFLDQESLLVSSVAPLAYLYYN